MRNFNACASHLLLSGKSYPGLGVLENITLNYGEETFWKAAIWKIKNGMGGYRKLIL
jgi:hypothetical protein